MSKPHGADAALGGFCRLCFDPLRSLRGMFDLRFTLPFTANCVVKVKDSNVRPILHRLCRGAAGLSGAQGRPVVLVRPPTRVRATDAPHMPQTVRGTVMTFKLCSSALQDECSGARRDGVEGRGRGVEAGVQHLVAATLPRQVHPSLTLYISLYP